MEEKSTSNPTEEELEQGTPGEQLDTYKLNELVMSNQKLASKTRDIEKATSIGIQADTEKDDLLESLGIKRELGTAQTID